MVSLSLLLDWDWWPATHGAVDMDTGYPQHIEAHTLCAVSILAFAFARSRWCTPTTFQHAVLVVLLVIIVFVGIRPLHYRMINPDAKPGNNWLSGCEACTNRHEQLVANIAAGRLANDSAVQTISFVYPRRSGRDHSQLYGLVLHPQHFRPGGQGPRFTDELEAWMSSILTVQLHDNWNVVFVSLLLAGAR